MALAAQALLALAAGLAQAAALAWPGNGAPLWWLQLASMALLAWLLRGPVRRQPGARAGALLGALFACAWLVGTFWWLFISMHRYGALPAPLAAAAVLALAGFLASYYALAAGLFCRLALRNRLGNAMLFAALWLAAELARASLWTGFPWGAGGYAHTDGPLAALARYIGVYGIGAVSALLAMLAVQARRFDLRSARAWALLLALVGLLAAAAAGRRCAIDSCAAPAAQRPAPTLSLELLQGNIAQDEKFQPGSGVAQSLDWYAKALRAARAELVLAPETAIPLLAQQLPPGYLQALQRRYAQGTQAALLGIPGGDAAGGYTNSVLALAPAAAGAAPPAYRYDKHHLVPFGEFIPPLFKWFTQLMQIPLGDFNRGAPGQPSFAWAGQRIAPNICYEDLFGEELALRFLAAPQAPTILANFSNIGWFGDSSAIDQHLQISRMRVLEFERPMLRATNTGATAIIDHRGRVTQQLARQTRGVLRGQVQGRGLDAQRGWSITPYAWWAARAGLWPLWAWCALVLAGALLARWPLRRPRAPGAAPQPPQRR